MDDLISRQDAYDVLTDYYHHRTEIQHKGLKEALSRVPPAQPEIIRCKDCKYWTHIKRTNRYWCKTDDGLFDLNPSPDDYRSRAERRDNE